MGSLERIRHKDLDMVDPEGLNRAKREVIWDDLKDVPFAGDQVQSTRQDIEDIKELKNLVNSLSSNNEEQPNEEQPNIQKRAEKILSDMDKVGSFGKTTRESKSQSKEYSKEIDDANPMSLSDLSETF